jgi:hypothetical protein
MIHDKVILFIQMTNIATALEHLGGLVYSEKTMYRVEIAFSSSSSVLPSSQATVG